MFRVYQHGNNMRIILKFLKMWTLRTASPHTSHYITYQTMYYNMQMIQCVWEYRTCADLSKLAWSISRDTLPYGNWEWHKLQKDRNNLIQCTLRFDNKLMPQWTGSSLRQEMASFSNNFIRRNIFRKYSTVWLNPYMYVCDSAIHNCTEREFKCD